MNYNPTRVSGATVLLGDRADDVQLDVRDGHTILVLGSAVAIVLDLASQEVLDKLSAATAQAASIARLRSTLAVA